MKLLGPAIQELNIGYLWIDAYCVIEGERREGMKIYD